MRRACHSTTMQKTINFFPLKEKSRCLWCENLSSVWILDTEKKPAPICQMHINFFTEPKTYWAWKNRTEETGLRTLRKTHYTKHKL